MANLGYVIAQQYICHHYFYYNYHGVRGAMVTKEGVNALKQGVYFRSTDLFAR